MCHLPFYLHDTAGPEAHLPSVFCLVSAWESVEGIFTSSASTRTPTQRHLS